MLLYICNECSAEKPESEFYYRKDSRTQRYSRAKRCKGCYRNRAKEAGKRRDHRANGLKARYGLSLAQYEKLLNEQNGMCANTMCGASLDLVVDHCHASGLIRGILCRSCNLALGYCEDNIDILHGLVRYLER